VKTNVRHMSFHLWLVWIRGFLKRWIGWNLNEKKFGTLGEILKMFTPEMVLMLKLWKNIKSLKDGFTLILNINCQFTRRKRQKCNPYICNYLQNMLFTTNFGCFCNYLLILIILKLHCSYFFFFIYAYGQV
jgi:hypothetical protein